MVKSVDCQDFGFLYGFSLFETFLVDDKGDVFLLESHINRLLDSMEFFKFKEFYTKEYIKDFILGYIKDNDSHGKIMRVTVSYGNDNIGIKPQIIITARDNRLTKDTYEKGYKIQVSNVRKSDNSFILRHKTSNYMENHIIGKEVFEEGFDDALFLNANEKITETTKCNIFFVKSGTLYTPSIECGLLPGIIRGWVIKKALNLGVKVCQGKYDFDQLLGADEVFLTNSVVGIMKVSSIGSSLCKGEEVIVTQLQKECNITCDVV
ncbi:UNVERIFIED_CONTAM: branched-chain amino acid aminotransferase/4-amino-4-deoxychorismate lyase [Acetivibrio alkalicellulosi]